MLIDIGDDDELIGSGFLNQRAHPFADRIRRADDGARQHPHRLRLLHRRPIGFNVVDRRLTQTARATEDVGERHLLRRGEPPRFLVAFGGDDVDADDRVGPVELLGGLEPAAVNLKRGNQMIGREMRSEGIRQPQFGRQHRAEMARSEDIERHFRSGRRDRLDALIRSGRRQECLQFHDVLRKGVGGLRRTPQGVQRELIGARRAAEPEIDPAGKKPRQCSELLGDDVGRMVRKHDASRADPNGLRSFGDMGKHDRCRGAGDARHIVMLRHPDALIAPCLGVSGKVARIVERAASVGVLRDANKLENG